MIEAVSISTYGTYGPTPQTLSPLSKFNYIFGSNGSGKTTISRVIATPHTPGCSVTWRAGNQLKSFVYNIDFVESNLKQSAELKGIFTLGAEQIDTQARIDEAKEEAEKLQRRIVTLIASRDGHGEEVGLVRRLQTLNEAFRDKCWAQKQKHDSKFRSGFEGVRSSAEKFKAKVLNEFTNNQSTLRTQADLERLADSVFVNTPIEERLIGIIDFERLLGHHSNAVMKKPLIGKDDVDIAAMIRKLNNSDWVRQGMEFFRQSAELCPFCQEPTKPSLAKSLAEYFDDAFVNGMNDIDTLQRRYAADAAVIREQLLSLIASRPKFLDLQKVKSDFDLLEAKIALNIQTIAEKRRESSRVLELESVEEISIALAQSIASANSQIVAHNAIAGNLASEIERLKGEIWRFIIEELRAGYDDFMRQVNGLAKGIAKIQKEFNEASESLRLKENEIRELERQTTSVQPTISAINALLTQFGFQGFRLDKGTNENMYKLVRQDGTDAIKTLSEGEKTFVTFLYFYHLLHGSDSAAGLTADRVVVIDDPVSSLDSDVLFIVGSLIKDLFDQVRTNVSRIKQVFVLTHNVYFHKEVTYNSNRKKDYAMNEETFWIVRKQGNNSKLEQYTSNPIRTSYELLWAEVRRPDKSCLTIQNTLRRILENYFRILGQVDFTQLVDMFTGVDKVVCRSLFSWIHDGSHYAHDDLYVANDDLQIAKYVSVFRRIFYKSKHEGHYKMMMGDSFEEEVTAKDLPEVPSP